MGRHRVNRVVVAVCVVAVSGVPLLSGQAAGRESLDDLKQRMEEIQAELDAATARIEQLRTQEDELVVRLQQVDVEIEDLERAQSRLEKKVVAAAQNIYRAGGLETLEVLLTAQNFADLSMRATVLERISKRDATAFIEYERNDEQLTALRAELIAKKDELAETRSELNDKSEELHAKFEEVADEYNDLKKKIAAAARRAAAAQQAQDQSSQQIAAPSSPAEPQSAPVVVSASGMTCPVAGPNSFIDSWGFPRSGGRTHEGTDIMAAFGTPVVAIVTGTITYAGYGDSAGNWLQLSGDDGNGYWYMHNQENLVTGGRVTAGQQIATVGNTGNASGGPPHVHFEYHPGGGGPVNPYPLLSSIC
jgi:murein DD-endopeptidase MepM/ murein hydrolase activator NlpD